MLTLGNFNEVKKSKDRHKRSKAVNWPKLCTASAKSTGFVDYPEEYPCSSYQNYYQEIRLTFILPIEILYLERRMKLAVKLIWVLSCKLKTACDEGLNFCRF